MAKMVNSILCILYLKPKKVFKNKKSEYIPSKRNKFNKLVLYTRAVIKFSKINYSGKQLHSTGRSARCFVTT